MVIAQLDPAVTHANSSHRRRALALCLARRRALALCLARRRALTASLCLARGRRSALSAADMHALMMHA